MCREWWKDGWFKPCTELQIMSDFNNSSIRKQRASCYAFVFFVRVDVVADWRLMELIEPHNCQFGTSEITEINMARSMESQLLLVAIAVHDFYFAIKCLCSLDPYTTHGCVHWTATHGGAAGGGVFIVIFCWWNWDLLLFFFLLPFVHQVDQQQWQW